jgi:hypothetical protein
MPGGLFLSFAFVVGVEAPTIEFDSNPTDNLAHGCTALGTLHFGRFVIMDASDFFSYVA